MKKIIYTRPEDQGLSIIHPAPWNRLCRAVTFNGVRIELPAPTHFDILVRQFKTDQLSPEWAETEDEFVDRIFKKDVPADAINPTIVDESVIPKDRTFRSAWMAQGASLIQDMSKCREIHREKMRKHRKGLMEKLDADFMKALEDNDQAALNRIKQKKQKLRDITQHPSIAQAATPEELKQVWPFEE